MVEHPQQLNWPLYEIKDKYIRDMRERLMQRSAYEKAPKTRQYVIECAKAEIDNAISGSSGNPKSWLSQWWVLEGQTHVDCYIETADICLFIEGKRTDIKSTISGIFTLAKQQDYFQAENPARDTKIDPRAAEQQETYAYSIDELQSIISLLPEPAATAFSVAAYMGLRHGEIQGLLWENYQDNEIYVSRSIWNGRVNDPKTRKGRAPVPVIRQLAERLELHRLRCGSPQSGPIFANAVGKPLALTSVVNRAIVPSLNRCENCHKRENDHSNTEHEYKRDERIPVWHGWHAARRGLGSNLYRLGVPDIVIQRILRHANVSTTATYYIKTAADDVRNAMLRLETKVGQSSAISLQIEEGSSDRGSPPAVQ
jgi:integrase